MSPEETFRRVLAARLPAGPAWGAWIDGTVAELASGVGVVLTPEEAARVAHWYWADPMLYDATNEAIAERLQAGGA